MSHSSRFLADARHRHGKVVFVITMSMLLSTTSSFEKPAIAQLLAGNNGIDPPQRYTELELLFCEQCHSAQGRDGALVTCLLMVQITTDTAPIMMKMLGRGLIKSADLGLALGLVAKGDRVHVRNKETSIDGDQRQG